MRTFFRQYEGFGLVALAVAAVVLFSVVCVELEIMPWSTLQLFYLSPSVPLS